MRKDDAALLSLQDLISAKSEKAGLTRLLTPLVNAEHPKKAVAHAVRTLELYLVRETVHNYREGLADAQA
jgi:hypothetical protein